MADGSDPRQPVRTGGLTVTDNAYEIAFPGIIGADNAPIQGSALTIQINRSSRDSMRIQTGGPGANVTTLGHCSVFDMKDKL